MSKYRKGRSEKNHYALIIYGHIQCIPTILIINY